MERDDGVLAITIDRPEKKNALTTAMYGALASALSEADADPAVRVILVTGAGGTFTAGNDLADFMEDPPSSKDTPVFAFLEALAAARKPLIAAVPGPAVGVGTTMLLHCDLVYAASSAVFRMPFVDLGLCPEAGSSLLLPRVMGHARAAELLLLGDLFDAARARSLGIVTAIVPDEELASFARERAATLAHKPPGAVRLTKSLMKRATAERVREQIHAEGDAFLERLRSPEAAEAFRAFFERREPDFSSFD